MNYLRITLQMTVLACAGCGKQTATALSICEAPPPLSSEWAEYRVESGEFRVSAPKEVYLSLAENSPTAILAPEIEAEIGGVTVNDWYFTPPNGSIEEVRAKCIWESRTEAVVHYRFLLPTRCRWASGDESVLCTAIDEAEWPR